MISSYKVSLPAPPFNVSLPVPPVIILSLLSPVNVSSPEVPTKFSKFDALPVDDKLMVTEAS